MTRNDAEEAIAALGRAIVALGHDEPELSVAARELSDALEIMQRVPNVYADTLFRPGLNKPTESAPHV